MRKFPTDLGLKIPHMGWNSLNFPKPCPLFENLPGKLFSTFGEDSSISDYKQSDESYFYFVHSYYVEVADKSMVSAIAQYGLSFDAAISKDNVYATQFHPEKSGKVGLAIIDNFLKVVRRV